MSEEDKAWVHDIASTMTDVLASTFAGRFEGIEKRLDHADEIAHALQQQCDRIEAHLVAIAADVAAARPLLEKWQRSAIGRFAKGEVPWSHT